MALAAASAGIINKGTVGPINGAVAVILGLYLMAAVYQGNGTALRAALSADFFSSSPTGKGPGYAVWLVAFLILYAIAANPSTRWFGSTLFTTALLAMLINLAGSHFFGNLTAFVRNPAGAAHTAPAGPSTTNLLGAANGP